MHVNRGWPPFKHSARCNQCGILDPDAQNRIESGARWETCCKLEPHSQMVPRPPIGCGSAAIVARTRMFLAAGALVAAALAERAAPGSRWNRQRRSVPAPRRRLVLPDAALLQGDGLQRSSDGGHIRPFTHGGDRRPQHVDRLDRRQRSALGPADASTASARFDFLKTLSSHPAMPATAYGRDNRWRVSRPGQRAVLHEGDRPRSEPLRPVARRARSELPAGSVRGRGRSTRASRSARAARPCRSARTTASPPASSGCGCSRTRTSTRRRGSAGTRSATTTTRRTTTIRDLVRPYRVGMSCGVLPRRPESGQAAGRSREPEVGEPQLERRRAVSSGGTASSTGRATATRRSFFYQALHTSRPGTLDTSLVSTDNINNPRTMNAVYYLGPRMGLAKKWGKETHRRRRAGQPAVQRLRARRPIRWRSSSRSRTRRGRRACSRTAPTRSARSARSTACTSTSACSARSGCCTSAPLSAARPISPIEIADAQKNSVVLAGHRAADAGHGALLPRRAPPAPT